MRLVEVKKTITLRVDHFDKIDDVKDKFCQAEGVEANLQKVFLNKFCEVESAETNLQKVFFTEECFQNGQILDYKKKDGSSSVHMNLRFGNRIQIHIIGLRGWKAINLDVDAWETIGDIKRHIEKEGYGVRAGQLTFVHCGNQLEDCETVSDCGLDNDSILHAVILGEDKFEISVKMPGQETIKVKVRFSSRVEKLKNIIYAMMGIQVGVQKLTFKRQSLENRRILADYNIRKSSVVDLTFASPGFMKIFLDFSGWKRSTLYVNKTDTINNLKEKVLYLVGTAKSTQKIHFNGQPMQDHLTLGENEVKEGDTLVMLPNHLRS